MLATFGGYGPRDFEGNHTVNQLLTFARCDIEDGQLSDDAVNDTLASEWQIAGGQDLVHAALGGVLHRNYNTAARACKIRDPKAEARFQLLRTSQQQVLRQMSNRYNSLESGKRPCNIRVARRLHTGTSRACTRGGAARAYKLTHEVHGATHSLDHLARDNPVSQVTVVSNLRGA